MPTHIEAAKNALFCHIEATDDASFVDGKMIFLQGSPILEKKTELIWDDSRALWLIMYQNTFKRTDCHGKQTALKIKTKVDAIVEETHQKDMRLISGIPPWVSMYYEKLAVKTGKKVGDLFKL